MPRLRNDRPEPPRDALAFTLRDAARLTGVSVATLRRRANEGALLLTRVGGRTLVVGDSLRALFAPKNPPSNRSGND